LAFISSWVASIFSWLAFIFSLIWISRHSKLPMGGSRSSCSLQLTIQHFWQPNNPIQESYFWHQHHVIMTEIWVLIGNCIYWTSVPLMYKWLHSSQVFTMVCNDLYCAYLFPHWLYHHRLVARLWAQIMGTHRLSVYWFVQINEKAVPPRVPRLLGICGYWGLVLVTA
jgi:hypothetical protein